MDKNIHNISKLLDINDHTFTLRYVSTNSPIGLEILTTTSWKKSLSTGPSENLLLGVKASFP